MSHETPVRVSVKALLQYEGASENRGKVLVLRENKGNNSGKYHFPGGHIEEYDDGPREALRREIGEETGFTQVDIAPLPYYQCKWPGKFGAEVLGKFYICRTNEQEVTLSKEHDHALWMPPEDYRLHPMVSHSEQIIETYLETQRRESQL